MAEKKGSNALTMCVKETAPALSDIMESSCPDMW
eukprot:CAMPEP_0184439814 /NCGR_PEP_ID=MMETSP0738-20130409/733041_1 /TAXON_ID=385413 /ORGANISM="Thalassiosira miniscula, Strain CCMP1093" /LENGTH=33 /DNA_ID= /DNA_START= /DNA_END= /DNA_ORIENTATION=